MSFFRSRHENRETKREAYLKISQTQYIEDFLREYAGQGYKSEKEQKEIEKLPIREVIGKLWWLALRSRPDISCALHKCALWQSKPSRKLWSHLEHMMKYLNKTRLIFERLE